MFSEALRKKDEAARAWKEQNELKFDHMVTPASSNESKIPETHKKEEVNVTESPEITNTNTQTNNIPPTSREHEHQDPPENEAGSYSDFLLQVISSLSWQEKVGIGGFFAFLLYCHLSFHSLASAFSYDAILGVWSSLVSLIDQVSHIDGFDAFLVIFIAFQLTILFDFSPEKTDAALVAFTKATVELSGELQRELSEACQTLQSGLTERIATYRRKVPRIVRIMIALTVASLLVRYALLQILAALQWLVWSLLSLIVRLRGVIVTLLAVITVVKLVQLYRSIQELRRQSVRKLVSHVKSLLEQKPEGQAAIDHLFYEIEDCLQKQEREFQQKQQQQQKSQPTKSSSSSGGWSQVLAWLPSWILQRNNAPSETLKTETVETTEAVTVEEPSLHKRDLNGYEFSTLWNDVVKEVGRDKRIRTNLMMWNGAQMKFWKLLSPRLPH